MNELEEMRQRIVELEASKAKYKRMENITRIQRDLAVSLSAITRLDEAIRLCVKTAVNVLEMDCGGFYLVDKTSGGLDLVFHEGLPPDFVKSALHYDADSDNTRLIMTGKPIYSQYQNLGVALDETNESLRAVAVIPVCHEDQVIGCLNIASHSLDEVPPFARDALEMIVAQIGSAIVRLEAEEELRKHREHLEELVKERTIDLTKVNEALRREIHEREIMEGQLAQARKLKAIGQLAAGMAHEINTPTQYVGDNTRFLQESFAQISGLFEKFQRMLEMAKSGDVSSELVTELESALDETDIEYLWEEIPTAIQQSLAGVTQVTEIVHTMKEFARPGTEEKLTIDLNGAIESIITVARIEWDPVAEVETGFDADLPAVTCLPAEINQVILNVLTNAAHTIADVVGDGSESSGTITISTHSDDDWVEIRISDTGTGIPEEIRTRVFDPFFTTKEVGKGTGQGLTVAHNVVVELHGGTIAFETEMGKGTTFIIRLPVHSDMNE